MYIWACRPAPRPRAPGRMIVTIVTVIIAITITIITIIAIITITVITVLTVIAIITIRAPGRVLHHLVAYEFYDMSLWC